MSHAWSVLTALALATGCISDEELATDEVESAASVYFWSNDASISGQKSPYQVGLATLNSRVNMVYTTSYGYLYAARFDGFFWTSASQLPIAARADYGPALASHGGQLVLVFHARGENRLLMSRGNGSAWSTPVTAGSTLGGATILNAPALVSHDSMLYLGYCTRTSAGDRVRIDRLDGASWTKVAEFPSSLRCKHVTLGSLPDGRLDILATFESGSTGTWFMYEWSGIGTPSSTWPPRGLSMKSKKPMSIVTCGGDTHLVHGGYSTPREIWWTVNEGGEWLGDTRIPDQASEGGSALACLGTRTIMVHNGGYSDLWWASYTPE